MSFSYRDYNSDVVDQNTVISRVPGVLDSIQLKQVPGITEGMSRIMKTAVNDTSSNVATNIRQQIEELKRQKARKKSTTEMEDCQEEAVSVMEALMDMYTAVGDQEIVKKINEELETLKSECTSKQSRAQECLDSRAHEESSASSRRSYGKST